MSALEGAECIDIQPKTTNNNGFLINESKVIFISTRKEPINKSTLGVISWYNQSYSSEPIDSPDSSSKKAKDICSITGITNMGASEINTTPIEL